MSQEKLSEQLLDIEWTNLDPEEKSELPVDLEEEKDQAMNATEQPVEPPRRSERERTLTEKGKELHRDKTERLLRRFEGSYERWKALTKVAKKSVINQDPNDILREHINSIQRELSELDVIYDDYRKLDSPPQEMRRKMDNCLSITNQVVENAKSQIAGTTAGFIWPDAPSVFATTACSSLKSVTRADSVHTTQSAAKRQEAAAEYAATQAVLRIMAEQDEQQERLLALETENRLIVATQEADAVNRRLQAEREETERKIQKEKHEAALVKKQQEENAARQKSLDDLKRELQRLEELKRLNAAKARLQVYDESEFNPIQGFNLQHSELPKVEPVVKNENPVYPTQYTQPPYEAPEKSGSNAPQDDTGGLVKVLAEAISANRLPIPEPTVFTGDPLKFRHWKSSFQTLIERKNIPTTEKLFFLQKYVGGGAKEAIEGYFMSDSDNAYQSAWDLLHERFGKPFVIAKAFRDKLHSWPKIASKESGDLRKFVDFLRSCDSAMTKDDSLNILNDGIENQKLSAKLPDWLCTRWNRKATQYQLEHDRFPSFNYFVAFLSVEANIACNPITSYQAIHQSGPEKAKVKNQNEEGHKKRSVGAKTFTTNTSEKNTFSCMFCKKAGHSIHKCRKFIEEPVEDRVKHIKSEKLCFGCLKPGHLSKNCTKRMTCDTCSKRHPTCLHADRLKKDHEPQKEQESKKEHKDTTKERKPQSTQPKDDITEATAHSHRVGQDGNSTQTSAIIPVYVSTPADSNNEVMVYALLDSQSDSSFILEEVADSLDASTEQVKLKLSTMSSKKTIVHCKRIRDLQVRGIFSGDKITVPTTYTREFIPANKKHIPTPETAKAWSHLEHLTENIAPPMDCEIGLLIGYNCPQALMPREVVCGEKNQPFAQKTDLGWSIVSYGDPGEHEDDAIGVSHRIIVRQVTPELNSAVNLKDEVHFVCNTRIKEVVTPVDVLKVLESDFSERVGEETPVSQEDLHFLTKLKEGIKHKQDGYYEMPLPFKQDRPNLPNNKSCAVQRLKGLEKRLKRDQKYCSDYVNIHARHYHSR